MSTLRDLVEKIVSFGLVVAVSCLLSGAAHSQSRNAQSNASGSAAPTTSPGFSIESEMLTYRALESNSDAIACEIAYLLAGQRLTRESWKVSKDSPGQRCENPGSDPAQKVIILPFDSNVVSDFAVWRSDMETIAEMLDRSSKVCSASGEPVSQSQQSENISHPPSQKGEANARSSAGSFIPLFNPWLTAASSALGLFASDHSAAPVVGTIEDHAFIDNVGRDLRVLNVTVLSPSVYSPNSLGPLDSSQSPFLTRLTALLNVHDCLVKIKDDRGVQEIENFLAVLSGTRAKGDSNSSGPDGTNPDGSNNAARKNGSNTAGSAEANSRPFSHLYADLSADGLAHALGVSVDGKLKDTEKIHVLFLGALESGGEVSRLTNIFGTRISYSGGAIGTYVLFALDGQVECEGNVYDYAGPVPFKNFEKKLRDFASNPSSQVMFHRGHCPALSRVK
jgi:hypothetical protein